jgi:alpha/beta superfamily hydrolase
MLSIPRYEACNMVFKPPAPQPVVIPGPSGDLEAIVEIPDSFDGARMAVVCHPHPLHGGTMTNKVVHTLARTFNECGLASVRFNYRGVGKSGGRYDEGRGETEDALAVIDWAQQSWPAAALCLAGFSFGGGVAFRAATQRETVRLITVAPSLARYPDEFTALPRCPWLLIQGDQDEVIDAQTVISWARGLATPPEMQVLAGAGHYFHGRLNDLREIVRTWIGG